LFLGSHSVPKAWHMIIYLLRCGDIHRHAKWACMCQAKSLNCKWAAHRGQTHAGGTAMCVTQAGVLAPCGAWKILPAPRSMVRSAGWMSPLLSFYKIVSAIPKWNVT
jgi:hypothetical protein